MGRHIETAHKHKREATDQYNSTINNVKTKIKKMLTDNRLNHNTLKEQQKKVDLLSRETGKESFNVTAFCNEYKNKLEEVLNGHCSRQSENISVCNTCQEGVILKRNV